MARERSIYTPTYGLLVWQNAHRPWNYSKRLYEPFLYAKWAGSMTFHGPSFRPHYRVRAPNARHHQMRAITECAETRCALLFLSITVQQR
ncbi:hypothetical protein GQ44DRAFT_661269 [Phaeosphaeriaceae sp. PMI808]|nr:hypothetical protein GQ44DRAFT_661269 [Phaeosphaeriaceae sp. PMI808]